MILPKNSKDFCGLTLQASIKVAIKKRGISAFFRGAEKQNIYCIPFASSNSPIVRYDAMSGNNFPSSSSWMNGKKFVLGGVGNIPGSAEALAAAVSAGMDWVLGISEPGASLENEILLDIYSVQIGLCLFFSFLFFFLWFFSFFVFLSFFLFLIFILLNFHFLKKSFPSV